jgi:hypothetical protein
VFGKELEAAPDWRVVFRPSPSRISGFLIF